MSTRWPASSRCRHQFTDSSSSSNCSPYYTTAPVSGHIKHTVGIAPLVVEPGENFDQAFAADPRLAGINYAGSDIVIEVAGCQRLFSIAQYPIKRAFGGVM